MLTFHWQPSISLFTRTSTPILMLGFLSAGCHANNGVAPGVGSSITNIAPLPVAAKTGEWNTAPSVFETAPPDSRTVIAKAPQFAIVGDGVADDAPAIQKAIDESGRLGVPVFLPSGTYRLGATLNLWKGIRLLGVGATRPVLKLAPNSGWPVSQPLVDFKSQQGRGGNDTFYSSLDNVNLEIGENNVGTVGIRFNVAQGSTLKNLDFKLSTGTVGVREIGNEIFNCRFFGGDHAIIGERHVAWQTLVMDCRFVGQTKSAVATDGAGLTFIRAQFADTPHAVEVRPSRTEHLYLSDCRFERIERSAILADKYARPQDKINLEKGFFESVPLILQERGGAAVKAPTTGAFGLQTLSRGLIVRLQNGKTVSKPETLVEGLQPMAQLPAPVASDIAPLPPVTSWRSAKNFGAKGDGKTDDTMALQKAVDGADVVFLPAGIYRLSDTLRLRPQTRLIGLHPRQTMLEVAPNTPGFGDAQNEKAALEMPLGATAQFRGIGLSVTDNAGAVGALWRGGQDSLLDDVWVSWNSKKGGAGQKAGIIVDGGGGIFKNLWIANWAAQIGFVARDTSVAGKFYGVSIEHHNSADLLLQNVSNWEFYALQTESGPGNGEVIPVEIDGGNNLRFLNLYLYRTSGYAAPARVNLEARNSKQFDFRGVRSFSLSPHPARETLNLPDQSFSVNEKEFALFQF